MVVENNNDRFNILKTIYCYDYNINIINDDCCNYLNNNYDIFYWSSYGVDQIINIRIILKLYLSDKELKEIIETIPKIN